MAGKLHQVVAVVKGKKATLEKAITDCYHKFQKQDLYTGMARTYTPKDEEGERFPPENKQVQVKVTQMVTELIPTIIDTYDAVAAQENSNCEARADIVVEGNVLVPQCPVTLMFYLEKRLQELATFVEKIPVLDPSQIWTEDVNADQYATEHFQTNKTKKIMKNHKVAAATDRHPEQVQVYTEDVVVGTYDKVDFSGAIPARERNEMLQRVRKLQEAVKVAHEEANRIDIKPFAVGRKITDFVFGSLLER
jgi:hypothetical protein